MEHQQNATPAVLQNRELFIKITRARMPFGKYKGRLLIDMPEPYILWLRQKGFPKGELGRMLEVIYEVQLNGLDRIFDPMRGVKSELYR